MNMKEKDYKLQTGTTKEENLNSVKDELGVRYTSDGKKLNSIPVSLMDLDTFANYIIESFITKEDLNIIIYHMIESYDKTESFFHPTESSAILAKCTNNFNNINKVIQERAEKVIEEKDCEKQFDEEFFDLDWSGSYDNQDLDKDTEIRLEMENYYTCILRKIEPMAIERRRDRINHRFKVESRININNYEHSEYGNLIEFHHDGGWGVVDQNGVVLISNHLITKASNCHPLFHPIISSYVTNQLYVSTDRDTGLEGIISINPLKELLPCKYKIESMEGMRDGNYIFAFRALSKNGLWGCYNDRGKKIAKFKYQTIEFNQGFIECGRDGIFHLQDHDNGDGGWDTIFDGTKDLYDLDGHLILGGFTEFKYLEGYNLYLFYFGTYKTPTPYDVGDFTIDKYYTCYEEAKCLILDKDFNIFLNEEKICIKGRTIDSLEEIPSSCLVNGKVLEVLNNHVVSDETEFKNAEDIDGLPCYETETRKIVTFFNDSGHVEWRKAVDDYYGWSHPELVLIDEKVGFLKSTGIEMSFYDAISKDSNENGNFFAAKTVKLSAKEAKKMESNPNLQKDKRRAIQYYLVSMQDAPKRLEDNWETFNPNNISWFPDDFLEKMGVYCDGEYVDDYYEQDNGKSCGWSFEELEDAYMDALENDPSNEWNID